MNLIPFLFTYSQNSKAFDLNAIKDLRIFDPLSENSIQFFNLLHKLDAACFGDKSMGMDKWVMLDCAIMPGGIFGFGIESKEITDEIKRLLNISDDYKGLVPLSMFIAIPMANAESWFAHNLSSLNSQLKDKIKSLGFLTKLNGLKVLNIKKLIGITQWNSDSLFVHIKIGPLKILRAYTPMHTFPFSLVYECDLESDPPLLKYNLEFDISDKAQIHKVQNSIDSGVATFLLIAPFTDANGKRSVRISS